MLLAEQTPPPSPGLPVSPEDLVSTLFRHKWKIMFFALLGIAAAGTLYVIDKPKFESRAKVLVRYVTENRTVAATDGKEVVRETDPLGTSIMNSEAEILMSSDSVLATVRVVGAERVLAAYGGGSNPYDAAAVLMDGLKLDVGRQSRVLTITLLHRDPKIAQEALKAFIQEYRERHVSIHRKVAVHEDLQSERDQLRATLLQLEDQLRKEKNKAGVISLQQAKLDIGTQLSSLKTDLYAVRAEFAQRKAEVEQQEKFAAHPAATERDAEGTNKTATVPEKAIDPARVAEYQSLVQELASLRQNERELLATYTTNSTRVIPVQKQIRIVEEVIRSLGFDPGAVKALSAPRLAVGSGPVPYDMDDGRAKVSGLEARIKSLEEAYNEVVQRAQKLDASENEILRLERQIKAEEAKLAVYESDLERAKFDSRLDSSKITNITIIEEPTIGAKDLKKLKKKLAIALGGAIAAGLGLAFGIDFFLDRTVKRPKEMEQALQMPVFATIPLISGKAKALPAPVDPVDGSAKAMPLVPIGPGFAPWDEDDRMFSYYAALCDRLVLTYRGDNHKPKIIGFSSCHHGAGVTRLASGVAAALSHDLDRHVLYVGLERNRVSVASFTRGRPSDPLESEAIAVLNGHQKEICESLTSMVQTGRSTSGAGVVQGLSELLPKLETTDYDYIVLDLPPLTPTSGSIRLAAQCERLILVAEAEKTSKDDLIRAKTLLTSAGTNIFTVFNKSKAYGPLARKAVS